MLTLGVVLPVRWRRQLVPACASLGCAGGVAIALLASNEWAWRSTTLAPPGGIVAGVAVACAWLLAGALGDEKTQASAALTGVASAALLAATLNDWVVPALMFWLASSVALVALGSQGGVRVGTVLSVAVSDLALAGALTIEAFDERAWTMPESLGGVALGLALVSFVVRSGALPAVGVWESLDTPGVPALPLLMGGPLALLGPLLSGGGAWSAVGALLLGLICCTGALLEADLRLSLVAAWPLWVSAGLIAAAPFTLTPASLAALFAATAVCLWPATHGSARAERAFLLSLPPATAGFGAIVATAVLAFERAAGASSIAQAAPWSALAALLPATVAAGVALGARSAQQSSPHHGSTLATAGVRVLFGAAILVGLTPPSVLGLPEDTLGETSGVLPLYASAVLLGLGAAAVVARRAPPSVAGPPGLEVRIGTLALTEDRADMAVVVGVAVVVALGTLAALVVLVLEGYRYGFLPPSNL